MTPKTTVRVCVQDGTQQHVLFFRAPGELRPGMFVKIIEPAQSGNLSYVLAMPHFGNLFVFMGHLAKRNMPVMGGVPEPAYKTCGRGNVIVYANPWSA